MMMSSASPSQDNGVQASASRTHSREEGGGGVIERSWPTLPREEVEGEEEEEEGCRRLCWEEEESFCKKAPADAEVM